MPESHKDAVECVRDLIHMIGGHSALMPQSARLYGDAGVPDLYCMVNGRAFWVEVKVGKDKLSLEQAAFKILSDTCTVPVVVGRAGDVADFLGLTGKEPT